METIGELIDRLTIVNLKMWKWEDVKRSGGNDKTIADATRKTNLLNQQRNNLIQEIDEKITGIDNGQGSTKMYGDLNSKPANWLNRHRSNERVSQHGEYGILKKIFETIGTNNKWCVEFGAWDGLNFSNTFNLINDNGWFSVQIEPNGDRVAMLLERYASNLRVTCLQKEVHPIDPVECLIDNILKETKCPNDLDLIVIDVDGEDLAIWESMHVYKPAVVLIEFNVYKSVDSEGSSLREMNDLAVHKGYELIAVSGYSCGVNAFFVKNELFERFGIADNTISNFINANGSLANFE